MVTGREGLLGSRGPTLPAPTDPARARGLPPRAWPGKRRGSFQDIRATPRGNPSPRRGLGFLQVPRHAGPGLGPRASRPSATGPARLGARRSTPRRPSRGPARARPGPGSRPSSPPRAWPGFRLGPSSGSARTLAGPPGFVGTTGPRPARPGRGGGVTARPEPLPRPAPRPGRSGENLRRRPGPVQCRQETQFSEGAAGPGLAGDTDTIPRVSATGHVPTRVPVGS